MSGPMDAWDEALRETNRADDAERDRDHHSKRADAAEAKVEALEAVCEDEEAAHGETVDLAARRGQGLRARTVVAETERDCYRAKLIALMGVDAFEAWRAQSGLVEE